MFTNWPNCVNLDRIYVTCTAEHGAKKKWPSDKQCTVQEEETLEITLLHQHYNLQEIYSTDEALVQLQSGLHHQL